MMKNFIFLICHLYTAIFYNFFRKNIGLLTSSVVSQKQLVFGQKLSVLKKKLNWCAPNSTWYMKMIITHFRQKMHFGPFSQRVPHMITVFRQFDNVFIYLKMSLFFLVFTATTQNAHFQKIKSANSLLMLIIYKPASEQFFNGLYF